MKTALFFFFFLLVVLATVKTTTAEYIPTDLRLKSLDVETGEIKSFILDSISYRFSNKPLSIYEAWKYKVGDCTEMNKIAKYLLEERGIKSRMVYGYAECNNRTVRHDYLRLENGQIYDVLSDRCTRHSP